MPSRADTKYHFTWKQTTKSSRSMVETMRGERNKPLNDKAKKNKSKMTREQILAELAKLD